MVYVWFLSPSFLPLPVFVKISLTLHLLPPPLFPFSFSSSPFAYRHWCNFNLFSCFFFASFSLSLSLSLLVPYFSIVTLLYIYIHCSLWFRFLPLLLKDSWAHRDRVSMISFAFLMRPIGKIVSKLTFLDLCIFFFSRRPKIFLCFYTIALVCQWSFTIFQFSRLDILHSTLMFRHLFPTAPDTLGMHVFSFIVSPWSRIDVFMVSCTLAQLIDVKLINVSVTDMHYMLLFIHNLCCYLPYIYIYLLS